MATRNFGGNDPAFPLHGGDWVSQGMTYRQWLVGQALIGVMTAMAARPFLEADHVHTSLDNMLKIVDLAIEKEHTTRA